MPHNRRAPIVDAELELASRLRLGVTRLSRRLRQQIGEDASPTMLSALATIEARQPVALGELAQLERVRPPSMTRIVARLEERGLVARRPGIRDRRVAEVSLTPAGTRYVESVRRRKNAYLVRRLHSLEPDELHRLEDALEVIEKLMERDR